MNKNKEKKVRAWAVLVGTGRIDGTDPLFILKTKQAAETTAIFFTADDKKERSVVSVTITYTLPKP